ncbi:MAG TPA: hypothetical protein VMY16_03570 [Ilumatobacteraceae bacterium]|nr:hypothetical protein [Ilumatobacteraceae bacterium]
MTRFTDRVTRDLHQIADRSTPSSTAWDSIRTRIDDQADSPTTEVIMLSPDRNDPPKRGWMLAAAAGTVILIGGLVFAVTRSTDDDNVPTNTPVATLPAEPAPDAQIDPDGEAVVVPAPDAGIPDEAEPQPEPEVEPVTVVLTGTFSDGERVEVPSPGATMGTSGETTFDGEFSGVAPWTTTFWTASDGAVRGLGDFEFTGSIDGLGSGTLTFTDRWQVVDGVWSSTATITSGTESFEGATGTALFTSDPATPDDGSTGTYTWDITVPPPDSLVTVTARGTAFDPDFAFAPTDVEGQQTYGANTVLEGDMSGTAPHTGTAWGLDNSAVGVGDFELTGEIAGLGTGTMTYTDVWVLADGTQTYRVFVTGGTGDFEGITGTGTFIDEGEVDAYEFTLTAPVGR